MAYPNSIHHPGVPTLQAAVAGFLIIGLSGTSQSLQQSNRWVGQLQKLDVQHVGRALFGVNQQSVGAYFSKQEGSLYGATITHDMLTMDQDWGDGDTGSHLMWSALWDVSGTISPNFSELGELGMSSGGYTNAVNLDARKNIRVIIRDATNTFERVRLSEFRGSAPSRVVGVSENYGFAGDAVVFDESGAIRILHKEIQAAGDLGTPGASPVGVVIKDSNKNDSNRQLQIIGAIEHNSPSGTDFPETGLIVVPCADAGSSLYDHVNTLTTETLDAMIVAAEGFGLWIIEHGHNTEDSGTYKANLEAMIQRVKDRHIANGYTPPKFLIVIPWNSTGTHNMSASKVADANAVALAGGHDTINFWDAYGGVTPHGRTHRLDGTAVSGGYQLDPLHPLNTETAIAIAKDFEFLMQPENRTHVGNRRSRASVRTRSSLLRSRR